MAMTATVTSKGQITIPKQVRTILGIDKGSVVVFERNEDRIVIRPAKTLVDFKGVLSGKRKAGNIEKIRPEVKRRVAARVMEPGDD